jgi:peptidoglycan hydrolase-like protein with peptidoglycan-binding domain
VSRPAAGQTYEHALTACAASLERSRERRALAARLRARRRRTRGGTGGLAVALMALALAAPLTLAASTNTGHATTLLTVGSSGTQVAAIQRALGILETGTYDSATRRAVRAFQARNGLLVDGIVGPQTRAAMGLAGPPAQSARIAGSASPMLTASASSTLARIAACESGGDPTAVSADGRYRGKYQFSRETWRALGGAGDPATATEAEQDRMAAKLLAQAGTSPWPSCGR